MSDPRVWERNLRVLRGHYPALAERIAAPAGGSAPVGGRTQFAQSANCDFSSGDDGISVVPSATGAASLVIKGMRVHSLRDPEREGERLALGLEKGPGPILVLGFGLGYAAEAASRHFPDRPLVILERRREILRNALENRDMGWIARKNLVFVLGSENPASASAALSALRLFPGKPELLKNRALVELDRDWYGEAERQIQMQTAKDDINQATLRRFGKRWVRNLGANISAIRDAPGIAGLAGVLPPEIPVLLAAAGPSLDRIAPALPAIRKRAVIVAVDTALRFLLRNGTAPDFVLAVDPQFWNVRHLDRAAAPRTCLIVESAVYPPALRHEAGRTWLCGSLFPLGKFIEERVDPKGGLGAGGSVATTAWDFARTLGTASIWIAGLDLAFPEHRTHYRGAAFEEQSHAESNRLGPAETRSVRALRDGGPFTAPASDGGTVLTDRRLSLYAAWFENRFRSHPEVTNYGLSAGGLAIAGLIPSATEKLLALPPRRDTIDRLLRERIAAWEEHFHAPETAADRTRRYEEACAALFSGLAEIESLASEAASGAEKAWREARGKPRGRETTMAALRNLEKTNRLISGSAVKEVAGFLFPPLAELEKDLTSPAEAEIERHLELSAKMYRALAETTRYQIKQLTGKNA